MEYNFIVFSMILIIFKNESNYCLASDRQNSVLNISTDKRQNSSDGEGSSNSMSGHVSTRLTLAPPGSDYYRVSASGDIQTAKYRQRSNRSNRSTATALSRCHDNVSLDRTKSYKELAIDYGLPQKDVDEFKNYMNERKLDLKTVGDLRTIVNFMNYSKERLLKKAPKSEARTSFQT